MALAALLPDLAELSKMRLGDILRIAKDLGLSDDILVANLNDDDPKKAIIEYILATATTPTKQQESVLSLSDDVLLRSVLVFAASKDLRCFFWTSTAACRLEQQFPRTGGRLAAQSLLVKLPCHSANTPVARDVIVTGEGSSFDAWKGNYPIHVAAATGNLAATMGLLEMGAGLDQKNMFGYSALFWACAHDHREVVTYLVRRGADKNSANSTNGQTALHVATMNGHNAIVSYLVRHGADRNYYDNRGNIPINVTGWRGGAREAKGEANRQAITASLR